MISQIVVLIVLIALNAYFAATEIAFITLNDAKIEKHAKEGNKRAKQILKMLKSPSKFLSTIQIGITLAGFLSSAFASNTFADKLAPVLNNWIPSINIQTWHSISIILITIILSFFTLVFGELVPKRLAMKYYEKIAYKTIGIIRVISIVTAPFVKLLTISTNIVSKIFGVSENEEEIVTENLEMHFIELKKFKKKNLEADKILNQWLWLLSGKEEKVKMAKKENKEIKKAIQIIDEMSMDPKEWELYESREKAIMNYNSGMKAAERRGREERNTRTA